MVAVAVPVEKEVSLGLDSLLIGQIGVLPHVQLVILMEPFHTAITLRVSHWRKQQLGSDPQRQPHTLAQNIRMSGATAKTALIVDLGVNRDAHGLPDVPQKVAGIAGAVVTVHLSRRIA